MNCIKCWDEFVPEKIDHLICNNCYNTFIESSPMDYTLIVNIDAPKYVRDKYNIWHIYLNQIQCNKCWDIIRSKNRHHMDECSCWACMIDWWSHYSKIIWNEWDYKDIIENFLDI